MARNISILKVKRSASRQELVEEVTKAEHNFDVVLGAARALTTRTLLSHSVGGIQLGPLEDLVRDLKTILCFIRRDVIARFPSANFGGQPIAPAGQTLPPHISPQQYESLCPLAVFLRLVAHIFSQLHLKACSGYPDDWGKLGPLRNILVRLETQIAPISKDSGGPRYYPGLTPCIMFHEEHSNFTVSASTPRYGVLEGLDGFGRAIRYNHIRHLQSTCSPNAMQRIQEMEAFSENLHGHFKAGKTQEDREKPEWVRWQNPFESEGNSARLGGYGAAFNTDGSYKVACLLDYWRFQMERPRAAVEMESQAIIMAQRGLTGKTSCAEWELWITKVSSPPSKPWAGLNPPPRREDMSKAGTWNVPQRPPTVHPSRPNTFDVPGRQRATPHRPLAPPLPVPPLPRHITQAATAKGRPVASSGGLTPPTRPPPARLGQPPRGYATSDPRRAHPYAGQGGAVSRLKPEPGKQSASETSISTLQYASDGKRKAKSRSCCGFF